MTTNPTPAAVLNIMVIGVTVGKSAYIKALCGEKFDPSNHFALAGIEFRMVHTTKNGKPILAKLWDAGGHAWWIKISRTYFSGMNGFIVMYDITDDNGLEQAENLILEVLPFNDKAQILLVGTKCDLECNRAITKDQGVELASKYGLKHVEISSKAGVHIEESIDSIINAVRVTVLGEK